MYNPDPHGIVEDCLPIDVDHRVGVELVRMTLAGFERCQRIMTRMEWMLRAFEAGLRRNGESGGE